MPKIFINHSSNNLQPIIGWGNTSPYDANRISLILDTVGAGIALEKLGTSIPSPFARILLFKTAFEQVAAMNMNHDNLYGKLVSECLDFIEFLFLYGNSQNLKVKAWNIQQQLGALKNSSSVGHKKLAASLDRFARDLNVQDIYLFYYNNQLIGGSSPFTLVYTSPNWKRISKTSGLHGIAGNELFADYASQFVKAVPLAERDKAFRTMLTDYIVAFRNAQGFRDSALHKYVYGNKNRVDVEMNQYYDSITNAAPMDPILFANKYGMLQDINGGVIDISGRGGNNAFGIAFSSGTVVVANHNAHGNGDSSEATGNGSNDIHANAQISLDYMLKTSKNRSSCPNLPLVLTEVGVPNAIYVGGNPWNKQTVLTRRPDEPLANRTLPGGNNLQYPYVTDADFLEDELVQTAFELNSTGFMTFDAPKGILLPLKPTFFNYFDIKDINTTNGPKLKINKEGDRIIVRLSLPIECRSQAFIEMKREYRTEDVKKIPTVPGFNIALFPSYKIVGPTTVPNKYSVLIHDASEGNLDQTFYEIKADGVEKLQDLQKKERTPATSAYIEINQGFDLIVVDWAGARGMIIPNFKEIQPSDGSTPIGIDFGTSNTYICISSNQQGEGAETLEIGENDLQVLTLNKLNLRKGDTGMDYWDSFAGMLDFNASFDREFAPVLLGGNGSISLPYRTVVCEKQDYANIISPKLFGDINVGFNFLRETVKNEENNYVSNIKWSLSQKVNEEPLALRVSRVKAFCDEMAWIVKNKVMLSGHPTSRLKIFLTQPHTMSRNTRRDIKNIWDNAFKTVMGNQNVEIQPMTESIAPFFFMLAQPGANLSANAVNVDIGGGSTDILYADVLKHKFYYDSSRFAGDDIWGDGKPLIERPGALENGFVQLFENLLNSGEIHVTDQRREAYLGYRKYVKRSEDLINYIFRYEDEFGFTNHINTNDNLQAVLLTHLAALIYHIAQVLKKMDMNLPATITFSGMGSKYIQILASEPQDSKDLVGALLKSFSGKSLPSNFKVVFQQSPKEVTAKGAVLVDHRNLDSYKNFEQQPIAVYGFDAPEDNITYGEVRNYRDKALGTFKDFAGAFLNNSSLKNYLRNEFEFKISQQFIDTLKEQAQNGFEVMAKEGEDDDVINDSLFFWTLKNGLFEASKL